MADQADGADEGARVGRSDRLGLQPGVDVGEPGRVEPLRGVVGARVVPRPLPIGEVGRERSSCGDLVGQRPEGVDVADPAALGDQLAAGLQSPAAAPRTARVVAGSSGRSRWRRSRRPARAARARPGPGTGRDPVAERCLRVLDHRRRDVDARRPVRGARGRRASPVTLPDPQPASSTTSSPRSGSRSSCSRAQLLRGRRPGRRWRRPSRGTSRRPSQRRGDRTRCARGRARRRRSRSVLASVSAMSSSPLSSRYLISGSISNVRRCRPASGPPGGEVDLGLAGLGDRVALLGRELRRAAARSWCSWSGRCRRSSAR